MAGTTIPHTLSTRLNIPTCLFTDEEQKIRAEKWKYPSMYSLKMIPL
jgi:hypothetical protein